MDSFKFSYYLVNAERVGYLTRGFDVRGGCSDRYVAILVDGVELKEWFDNYDEQNKRYEEVKRILGWK